MVGDGQATAAVTSPARSSNEGSILIQTHSIFEIAYLGTYDLIALSMLSASIAVMK